VPRRSIVRHIGWGKIFSLRILVGAFVLGAIAAAILGAIWGPLAYLAVPVGLLAWGGLVTDPAVAVRCPHCHKRMKLGATVCHHCGRDAVAA
jgi:hypothetical protein